MKVLALGAHPDDIEIFMFGTLAAMKEQGADLAFAIATDGSRGGTGDPAALARTRREEARAAAALLGVDPVFLDFPDGELIPDASLISRLKVLVADTDPDLVITHAPNDYHADHRALSQAAGIAVSFRAPLLFAEALGGTGFEPTTYVDISAHFETKAAAIRAHCSQDPERFVERITAANGYRALQCNGEPGEYAEAFRFQPVFPFADIRDLLPPAPRIRPVGDRGRRTG
jgi:LmbE family N-acetylglucosaminyl deacetylase